MAGTRSRSILLALAGAGGVLIFAALFFSGAPRYHGRRLDGWDGWAVKLRQGNRQEEAEAHEALQAMGKSAVPALMDMLEKHDPPIKLKLLATFGKRLPWLERWWPPLPAYHDQSRAEAATALGEIGPPASNAIPALSRSSKTNTYMYMLTPAVEAALMKIRGEPIGPLLKILEDPDSAQFADTAFTIAEFGTNGRAAIPALCRALESKSRAIGSNPGLSRGITMASSQNVNVCLSAAVALGRIHSDPQTTVPALINAVNNGETENSLWALGQFEHEAGAAVPMLRQHLHDADPMVRQTALDDLARILPNDELKSLVPALLAAASDPDPNLQATGRRWLGTIDPEAAKKAEIK